MQSPVSQLVCYITIIICELKRKITGVKITLGWYSVKYVLMIVAGDSAAVNITTDEVSKLPVCQVHYNTHTRNQIH